MSLVCRLSCGRTQNPRQRSWEAGIETGHSTNANRPQFVLHLHCDGAPFCYASHTRAAVIMIHFGPSTPLPRLHPGALISPTPFIPPSPRDPARPRAIPSDPERSRAIPSDPEDRERELGNTASDALTTVPDLIARDDETPRTTSSRVRKSFAPDTSEHQIQTCLCLVFLATRVRSGIEQ